MRVTGIMLAFVVLAGSAWAEPGASTRPVQAPEPDVGGPGESAPVVLSKDNYEAKLSWFPAVPKPGDLVRYRLEIKNRETLPIERLVVGHGEPIMTDAAQRMAALVRETTARFSARRGAAST